MATLSDSKDRKTAAVPNCKFGSACLKRADCKFAHPAVTAGETVAQVKAHKKAVKKLPKQKLAVLHGDLFKAVRPLIAKKRELVEKQAAFRSKYVMVDSKESAQTPVDSDIKVIDLEMKALRETFTRTIGNRAFRIPLAWTSRVLNTAAGTNARTLSLDPSTSGDWASCAALFDEVRTEAVEIHYKSCSFLQATGATTAPTTFGVMAYDSVDLTVLTSIEEGLQKGHHALYTLALAQGAGAASFSHYDRAVSLRVQVPKGDLINSPGTSNTLFVGSSWASTVGTPGAIAICGAVEWFEQNATATGTACGDVVVYFDSEFRNRA